MIDTEDLEKLINLDYCWNIERSHSGLHIYYAKATVYQGYVDGVYKNGKTIKLHRILVDAKSNELIDHIDRNTLNNRKSNLRIINKENNSKNRDGSNSNNTSGYRNVSKMGKWWCVQIQIEGKNTILKKFPLDQLEEAGEYAELMRNKYYGEYAGVS